MFTGHFEDIYKQLGVLASASSGKTSQDARQLQCASETTTFLFCLFIMAKYSAILEPVTQALQAVELDVFKVQDHIQKLLFTFETYRKEADVRFKEGIMTEVEKMVLAVGIEVQMPRQCGRLTQRPNYQSKTAEEFYRVAIFIPYLDSLIESLRTRFVPDNEKHFALFFLHHVSA